MPNPGLAHKIVELLGNTAVPSWPSSAAPADGVALAAAIRDLWDSVRNGTGGSEPASNKSVIDALGATGSAYLDVSGSLYYNQLASPRCVVKSADLLTGTDPIFTITGGPVRATFYGRVTTLIVSTSSAKLTHTTTVPAATIDLCSAVAIDDDAAGTSYRLINTTAVFTPVTAGAVIMGNAFATDDTEFLLQPGSVGFDCTAARVGAVEWCMMYTPLSPASRVVAAA